MPKGLTCGTVAILVGLAEINSRGCHHVMRLWDHGLRGKEGLERRGCGKVDGLVFFRPFPETLLVPAPCPRSPVSPTPPLPVSPHPFPSPHPHSLRPFQPVPYPTTLLPSTPPSFLSPFPARTHSPSTKTLRRPSTEASWHLAARARSRPSTSAPGAGKRGQGQRGKDV